MGVETLSLNGEWQFSLGGRAGAIRVPGAWEVQGYSLDDLGPGVYQRSVDVPADWAGARVVLRFGAVSYKANVFVNGTHAGAHEGLWTAFELDVTDAIRPGAANTIEVRVVKPGKDGAAYHFRETLVGFIPYVSLTFGGIWQSVELAAVRGPAWRRVSVTPDARTGSVRVETAADDSSAGLKAMAVITDAGGAVVASETKSIRSSTEWSLTVANPALWSPSQPSLYHLTLTLERDGEMVDETSRIFGFRELRADGEQLLFNNAPIHLRGVLSWGWDPATLAPTLSEDAIRDEFRRVRELGFNLVKLCLFVPPDALFRIADEEGMLLWLELPLWYQRMTDHLREQTQIEYADILDAVQHHPSVVLYSLGCELGEDMADAPLLDELNTMARTRTSGVLVCDNSGSGEAYGGLGFDFADFNDYHFYCDLHNFAPLVDHFDRDWRAPRPWIFGEFCDCDDFRDVDEITEANGGSRPWWRELMGIDGRLDRWSYPAQEARMAQLNLPFSAQDVVRLSRRQSFAVRKTILEQVRARRGMGGYVVTGLRDTPISTSGMFDDLGRPKYEQAAFKHFNADRVLTLEIGRSRVWQHGGDRPARKDRFTHRAGTAVEFRIVLANAGAPFDAAELRWQLTASNGDIADSGRVALNAPMPSGRPAEIAAIRVQMPDVAAPARYTLRVELDGAHGVRNEWPMWAYPPVAVWPSLRLYDPAGSLSMLDDLISAATRVSHPDGVAGVLLTSALTPEMWDTVRAGGRVLLIQSGDGAFPAVACPFWRESIKLLYTHRVLSSFPHDGHADMQFYNLAADHALDTARFAAEWTGVDDVRPIMRRLDARLFSVLDYAAELRAGQGVLLATTLNFAGGAGDQVSLFADHYAGRFLVRAMLEYLSAMS